MDVDVRQAANTSFSVVLETPDGSRSFRCGADEYLWDGASRNGITLPAICHQGRCLTCAGRLLAGTVDQHDALSYFPEDQAAGFVLLCRAKPLGDLKILTDQQWRMRAHRQALGLPAPYA